MPDNASPDSPREESSQLNALVYLLPRAGCLARSLKRPSSIILYFCPISVGVKSETLLQYLCRS
jgi:hypothetical protein